MRKPITARVQRIERGFVTTTGKAYPFTRPHRHNELELGVMLKGSQTAMIGRRRVHFPTNRLVVFWGNTPHGSVHAEPGTTAISLFVPLPWFLSWNLPKRLVEAVLHGEVLLDSPRTRPCSDIQLMQHWAAVAKRGGEEAKRVVLLEVEARLRRLAWELSSRLHSPRSDSAVGVVGRWSKYEKMIALLANRYREPLTVPDVARAVGLHRVYAMRLFRKMSGTTIRQFLIQHRVSHAQRLIATTDKKVLTVAMESGFNSATQFHSSFRRIVGQTPQRYRRSLRG
jgi:AraC-like DNA-binding protein